MTTSFPNSSPCFQLRSNGVLLSQTPSLWIPPRVPGTPSHHQATLHCLPDCQSLLNTLDESPLVLVVIEYFHSC